jgi:phosphoglucomutase
MVIKMDIEQCYEQWLKNIGDPELAKELRTMSSDEKTDAFYKDLEFGTGGLRGVIGAGTNRMNIYTVGRATQGLCDYLKGKKANASAAIAYDSRVKSDLFARAAAAVFAANGITAYIFDELMPTPVLSFAVRSLNCDAGIVVTASHNPAAYNGYKVYGSDGCQITLEMASEVLGAIERVDIFNGVKSLEFDKGIQNGLIKFIGSDLLNNFLDEVQKCAVNPEILCEAGLRVVYTPLNGAGNKPVRAMLGRMGLVNLVVVPEQENPDGNFPTCKKPNPEERSAFEKALELGAKVKADLLLATDPDCDRVGIAVKDGQGEYKLLTGNETGCLLLEYILSQRKAKGTLPVVPVVIKTIVTTALAYKIAERYGAQVIDTLTGFKFIGEQIGALEKDGEASRYVFGFEESYGYLPGSYVRDKDAVAGSLLICEMASFYKKQGRSLIEVLGELYDRYGCFRHKLVSFAFEGTDGMKDMERIISVLRGDRALRFAGLDTLKTDDYEVSVSTDLKTGEKSKLLLPKSDVLLLTLDKGCEIVVRPSGTEPKLKCYLTAKAKDMKSADETLAVIENDIRAYIKNAAV